VKVELAGAEPAILSFTFHMTQNRPVLRMTPVKLSQHNKS